jgi:hypothetical protein
MKLKSNYIIIFKNFLHKIKSAHGSKERGTSILHLGCPGTHHGGGDADVQMVHASRWVIVVQVVMHMLVGALPATPYVHGDPLPHKN